MPSQEMINAHEQRVFRHLNRLNQLETWSLRRSSILMTDRRLAVATAQLLANAMRGELRVTELAASDQAMVHDMFGLTASPPSVWGEIDRVHHLKLFLSKLFKNKQINERHLLAFLVDLRNSAISCDADKKRVLDFLLLAYALEMGRYNFFIGYLTNLDYLRNNNRSEARLGDLLNYSISIGQRNFFSRQKTLLELLITALDRMDQHAITSEKIKLTSSTQRVFGSDMVKQIPDSVKAKTRYQYAKHNFLKVGNDVFWVLASLFTIGLVAYNTPALISSHLLSLVIGVIGIFAAAVLVPRYGSQPETSLRRTGVVAGVVGLANLMVFFMMSQGLALIPMLTLLSSLFTLTAAGHRLNHSFALYRIDEHNKALLCKLMQGEQVSERDYQLEKREYLTNLGYMAASLFTILSCILLPPVGSASFLFAMVSIASSGFFMLAGVVAIYQDIRINQRLEAVLARRRSQQVPAGVAAEYRHRDPNPVEQAGETAPLLLSEPARSSRPDDQPCSIAAACFSPSLFSSFASFGLRRRPSAGPCIISATTRP